MKLILRKALAFGIFSWMISSCSVPNVEEGHALSSALATETIAFKGERVIIPANFPKELFGQTQEEFDITTTSSQNLKTPEVPVGQPG